MKKKIIYFCAGVLLTSLILVAIQVLATAPNPGHDSSELTIGDVSCAWLTVPQSSGDTSCGAHKYVRGVRKTGYSNTSSHQHVGEYNSNTGCTAWAGYSSCSTGSGPATLYLLSAIECCEL